MRRLHTIRKLAVSALFIALLVPSVALAITQQQVIDLAKLGIAEDEIIKAIEKDRTVFNLSVTDILALKKAAVPDKVIKFMLATPKAFGDGTTTGVKTNVEPAAPAETAAQKAAREERMRKEAQKLLEEKRAAEEKQRKAFAQGVLGKGRQLGDDGEYVAAIKTFQQFVAQGNFAPESEEAYIAKFGIANALVKAGLYQSAARQLVDLVLAGPDKPFFQTAFEQLRTLRKKIDYSPAELEQLADMAGAVSQYSEGFQNQFNYVVGEFFHEGSEWGTAVAFLDAVTPRSRDFAKAQYLKGFMEVQNDLYKSAVQSFQRSIIATEENESNPAVRDLAFLALARIAYRVGDYDAAIYYYRKIPEGSYKQATAFYESSWVYFLKGDYQRALGTFHTLESPYFDHYFYPEMWILEATAYLNLCHFDRTDLALRRFEKEVEPSIAPLELFLKTTQKPEEYYAAVVSVSAGKQSYQLPATVVPAVLANVEFYNLYRTIKQIEKEQRRIRKDAGALGGFGSQLMTKLDQLRSDRIRQIGLTIRLILGDTLKELQKFSTKNTELRIDLEDIRIEEEERIQAARDAGEEVVKNDNVVESGSSAIVGSDTWRWPFEGEYWKDEIGAYRSVIKSRCAAEEQ